MENLWIFFNIFHQIAHPNAGWMSENVPATAGQRNYLEKLNAWDDSFTKAQASLEIRNIVAQKNRLRRLMANEPLTDKQLFFLKSQGMNTQNMSKLQAMQAISKIKQKQMVAH